MIIIILKEMTNLAHYINITNTAPAGSRELEVAQIVLKNAARLERMKQRLDHEAEDYQGMKGEIEHIKYTFKPFALLGKALNQLLP